MSEEKVCACCGKPAEGPRSVDVGVNGDFTSYCSFKCFSKQSRENAKLIRTLADRKALLAERRAYKKARIKQVLSKEEVSTSEDFYYLYESLSQKQKDSLSKTFFGHLIAQNCCEVQSIIKAVQQVEQAGG